VAKTTIIMPNQISNPIFPLEDWQWLVSHEGKKWLLEASSLSTQRRLPTLRKSLSPERAALVSWQTELRPRAEKKFGDDANRMLFTDKLLQQATSAKIATWKARQFDNLIDGLASKSVVDICVGLGGDLLALAAYSAATAIDLDPVALLLSRHNVEAVSGVALTTQQRSASEVAVEDFAAWHCDPDRRPQDRHRGGRTASVDWSSPNTDELSALLKRNPNACIKLAPAATLPTQWADKAEIQWIGHERECKGQLAWFGNLATNPGRRGAVVLPKQAEDVPRVLREGVKDEASEASSIEVSSIDQYLYEPHSAVRAAHLTATLCNQLGLNRLIGDSGYLTGSRPIQDFAVSAFEKLYELPLDLKRIKAVVREEKLHVDEVKTQGVSIDPVQWRKKLRLSNGPPKHEQQRCCVITLRIGQSYRAILARRLAFPVFQDLVLP